MSYDFSNFEIPEEWPWGGDTFTLALFSDSRWTDVDGKVHPAARTKDITDQAAKLCPGVVVGRTATVLDFHYQPTTLSPDNKRALITGVLFDENGDMVYTLFENWSFPDKPQPLTWLDLVVYNVARKRVFHDRYIDRDGTVALIQAAVAGRNIALAGTVLMVDGSATVADSSIETNDVVLAGSISDNVSGNLRVVITEDDGFQIVSSNPLDAGRVAYIKISPDISFAPAALADADMIDGVASVEDDTITGNEIISAFSLDANVFGPLQVVLVEGAGFEIRSFNGGDNGRVGWVKLQ